MGTEEIITVQCDQTNNVCNIPVYAPSAALVFLSSSALTENDGPASTTFATTALTQTVNTVTINPQVLATSNGHMGNDHLGSTSKGSVTGAARGVKPHLPALGVILSLVFGAVVLVGRGW